jgi:predicted deacetylase
VAAEYLLRLDDACPTMDRPRWDALLGLLASRGIRPIIAIVPVNADPALARLPEDPSFWQRARSWARAGCMIALHGYSHALRPSGRGLVPVHRRSEFVGLPIEEQRRRICAGVRVFEANGLVPGAWVAPAHGFDDVTLQALYLESDIRIISDGFTRRAVRRGDFVWLPQQLWRPRAVRKGLWTICLHPNEIDERDLRAVDAFVSTGARLFPDPRDSAKGAVDYGLSDAILAGAFAAALHVRRWSRKMKRKVE